MASGNVEPWTRITSWKVAKEYVLALAYDTEEYCGANAKLPWYERVFARSWLTIVYSVIPAILSVLAFLGVRSLVGTVSGATSSDPGVVVGMWSIVGTCTLEVGVIIMKTSVDPSYIERKPLFWIVLAAVWSASLLACGGNLGFWVCGVFWLGWWLSILVSDIIQLGKTVVHSIFMATLYATVFLALSSSVVSYMYVVLTLNDLIMEVLLTGGVYPAIALALKEVLYTVMSKDADEELGISEEDVEDGTFISTVVVVEVLLEISNKVAIARITSPYGFAGTMALSLAIEVAGKAGAMVWHRKKEKVANKIKRASRASVAAATMLPSFDYKPDPVAVTAVAATDSTNEVTAELQHAGSYKKAAHRHHSGNDRKRYEFCIYYEELGESVAAIAAFGVLLGTGDLQAADGLARLAFALFCEYLADLCVWSMLELDGYNLANVVYRFSVSRIGTQVFFSLCALTMISVAEEAVAMVTANVTATANTTAVNSTLRI